MGDDRGHAGGEVADLLEIAAGVLGALVVEQHPGVVGVAADRRQRLVEFVADARRHGAEGRELAGLDHFVLGAHQLALGLLAFVDFLLQLRVGVLQLAGAFQYALFQLALGLGLESDAVQVVTAAEVSRVSSRSRASRVAPPISRTLRTGRSMRVRGA